MSKKAELYLQIRICNYLRANYPDVLFNSDLSGIKLTIGQAVQVKKLRAGRSWPDIFISEPRNGYAGLFIELKQDRDAIYTKSGELRQDKHTIEQAEMLERLRKKGYKAKFACGDLEAKKLIDNYLMG